MRHLFSVINLDKRATSQTFFESLFQNKRKGRKLVVGKGREDLPKKCPKRCTKQTPYRQALCNFQILKPNNLNYLALASNNWRCWEYVIRFPAL